MTGPEREKLQTIIAGVLDGSTAARSVTINGVMISVRNGVVHLDCARCGKGLDLLPPDFEATRGEEGD